MAPGQFLTTTADPNKLGMPGAAAAQRGAAVQAEGLRWFGHLLKTERATKQATAEHEFGTALNQTIANAQSQNPAEAWEGRGATEQRAFVENALQMNAQKQATGISDPVVRRRFLTSANKSIIGAMPTIGTHLNNNYRDHSVAAWDLRQNTAVRTIAAMEPGAAREVAIDDMIKGLIFTGESRDWGPKVINKAIIGALSDIDHYQARTDFAEASTDQVNPVARVEEFLESLNTGERYKNLDIGKAASLASQAERALLRLTNSEIAKAEAKERKEERDIDREQDANFETISNEIDLARYYFSRGEEPPADLTVWSLPDLMNMDPLLERKLKPGQKKVLLQQLSGADKINNPQVVAEYEKRITDAFSEEELDAVEADLRDIYLDNPTPVPILGSKAYQQLTNHIKQVRGNTPAAAEKKRYAARVTDMLRSSGTVAMFTDQLAGADDKNIVATLAEEYYDNRVSEGIRPAQAFYETIQEYVHPNHIDDLTYSVFQSLPADVKAVFGTVEKDNLVNINTTTIFKAWDAWDVYSRGGLPSKVSAAEREIPTREQLSPKQVEKLGLSVRERMTTRSLYAAEQALTFLTETTRGRLVPDVEPPPVVPDTDDPGEDENAQRDSDEKWTTGVLNSIESAKDKANRLFDETVRKLGVGGGDDSAASQGARRGAGVN